MQGSIGNSPRFNECTPWPVQGWDMLLAARNNLQHVQTIDDQSVVAVRRWRRIVGKLWRVCFTKS